jgi:hypothetical protein
MHMHDFFVGAVLRPFFEYKCFSGCDLRLCIHVKSVMQIMQFYPACHKGIRLIMQVREIFSGAVFSLFFVLKCLRNKSLGMYGEPKVVMQVMQVMHRRKGMGE